MNECIKKKREEIDVGLLFGKDRAQEDKNLAKYFIKTRQYDDIVSGEKELVLGRKGSGKSALFSYVSTELKHKGKIAVQISPKGEEFARVGTILDEYKNISFNDDFKYSLAWREFILSEIAFSAIKYITERKDRVLYKYVVANGKLKGDLVTRFSNAILKVFSGGKISILDAKIDIDFSGVKGILDPEKEEIEESLKRIITTEEFFVLIDNLDEPWNNNSQMNSWLRGLILCIRQLKREFNNLKIVAFLRDDIYDEISPGSDLFDSRNEILQIKWKDNNNYSLIKLIATRIAVYEKLKLDNNLKSYDEMWGLYYPSRLTYNRNRKSKFLTNYIIERTFSRPRELLQFCRLIIEKSQSNYMPVEQEAVYIAEKEYCDWKIQDLVEEYSKTYKNIKECILSFSDGPNGWQYNYANISKHINSFEEHQKIYDKIRERYLGCDETIQFLYNCGFLRKVNRHSSGKVSYITSIDESTVSVKITTFDIHPAFRKKLSEI